MGTIAEKLTYLNTTKIKLRDSLNKFGSSILSTDTFRSYDTKLNDIYDKLPKVTQSGAGFTLENVQNGLVDDFKMIGVDLEQNTTKGNQLIDFNNPSYVNSNITWSFENDVLELEGTSGKYIDIHFNILNIISDTSNAGKVIEFGFKTISNMTGSGDRVQINITYNDGTASQYNILVNQYGNISSSYTIPNDVSNIKNATLNIYTNNKFTESAGSITIEKPLLYFDNNTDYEPYTGGIPSPNPDYPQDVRVVTGNNSVKVIGKNLFDTTITKTAGDGRIRDTTLETGKKLTWNGASATTGYMWLGYVIKDITNYVGKIVRFKTNFSASASNTPQYAIGICDSDGENRTSKASSSTSGNTISFTIPSLSGTQTYLYVLLYANSGGTLSPNDYVDFTNMILTIDNEDMTYIPYQSQTYPINLGTMELCKIGNYQDYIYKDNGKWYKHSEIGKVVLDGSEENLSYNSTNNRLQMPFNLQTQDWGVLALTLCDHFTMGDTEIVDGSFNITRTILFFKNNNLTSLNDWKTWLGSNNTTVYYILATPTNEEITDTTLINQLEAISVYTGTNIITISSDNDMIPEIEITRLKELEKLS